MRRPDASFVRTCRVVSHRPDMQYLATPRGSAPQPPRKGTLTVPLNPSAVPPWSPARGGRGVVGLRMAGIPCLRCDRCSGANRARTVGSAWPCVRHHRLFVSATRRLCLLASNLLPRRCHAGRYAPRRVRTATGPSCRVHRGAAAPGKVDPARRCGPRRPARPVARPVPWRQRTGGTAADAARPPDAIALICLFLIAVLYSPRLYSVLLQPNGMPGQPSGSSISIPYTGRVIPSLP